MKNLSQWSQWSKILESKKKAPKSKAEIKQEALESFRCIEDYFLPIIDKSDYHFEMVADPYYQAYSNKKGKSPFDGEKHTGPRPDTYLVVQITMWLNAEIKSEQIEKCLERLRRDKRFVFENLTYKIVKTLSWNKTINYTEISIVFMDLESTQVEKDATHKLLDLGYQQIVYSNQNNTRINNLYKSYEHKFTQDELPEYKSKIIDLFDQESKELKKIFDKTSKTKQFTSFKNSISKLFDNWKIDDLSIPMHDKDIHKQLLLDDEFRCVITFSLLKAKKPAPLGARARNPQTNTTIFEYELYFYIARIDPGQAQNDPNDEDDI